MSQSKRPLISINPYNGETLRTFTEMTPEEIDKAIARADTAFQSWREQSFSERASILKQAAKLFRERTEELARLMALEMGKKLEDGRGELGLCAVIFDYYADEGERILAPQHLSTFEGEGTLIHQPLGVVYGIQPWNFPFYQPTRFTAPNLIAGNVVLTKHASNVPQCAEAFAQLMTDAGVPEGVYTNLVVSSGGAASIIDDDRVQGVSFTGSNAGGAKVAEQAGRNGAFIEPGILIDIKKGSPAWEEELFGPIACVYVVPDEDAAVALANDSQFGLGGSVYTRDHERGRRVAEKLEAGTAFVNHISWTYASMPMGGVKKSGYGRELGELGIKEFVNEKLIRHFD